MALPNAYTQYNNNKIMTASPAELTLMLYEGAIKFCNIAVVAVENKNIPKAHTNIMKVQRIVEEFQITLDRKYPVAQDFDNVYNYILEKLKAANVAKGRNADEAKAILEEVLSHLRTMHETWKEVMRLNRTGAM